MAGKKTTKKVKKKQYVSPMATRIGERLKGERGIIGMSQKEFAKNAKISLSYVSMLECGHRLPSLDMLAKFCEVLHTSMSTFLADF